MRPPVFQRFQHGELLRGFDSPVFCFKRRRKSVVFIAGYRQLVFPLETVANAPAAHLGGKHQPKRRGQRGMIIAAHDLRKL
jgi:hypothetical protein